MENNQQKFTNNFNNYENTRFDVEIAMLMTLFSKDKRNQLQIVSNYRNTFNI